MKKLSKKLLALLLVFAMLIPIGVMALQASAETSVYETAYFPMDYLNITNGYFSTAKTAAHKLKMCVDAAGKDSGKDVVYAPFSGYIRKLKSSVGTCVIESTQPVYWADGSREYMHVLFYHCDNLSEFGLYVGKLVYQGEAFYREGTTGNATGNHIHMEVGRGKYPGNEEKIESTYRLKNQVAPESALFLKPTTVIKETGGINWRVGEGAKTAPSIVSLSINKTELNIGESFTLTSSADVLCSYYFSIFDADSGEIVDSGTKPGTYTNSFQRAGHYKAYMSAYNYYGGKDSNWVDFYVFGGPPTYATLTADKTELDLGESIELKTFTDAYYVKIYISIFNSNNEKVFEGNIPYDFSYTPEEPGYYWCYISASTNTGGVDSNRVDFSVSGTQKIKYPTQATISINKTEFHIGEAFTLTCSANMDCNYYCSIFDVDSGEKVFGGNISSTYTLEFQKAGHYYAYMSAYNDYGGVDSNRVDFYFYGDAPTTTVLTTDKEDLALGECITFVTKTDAFYVRINMMIFDEFGNYIYMDYVPYVFDFTPEKNGKYTAYVYAYTPFGSMYSNAVDFYVGEYMIAYNNNGGTGRLASQTKIYDKDLMLTSDVPTKDGFLFKEWNTQSDGLGISYLPGEIYSENSDITLYAQWICNHNSYVSDVSFEASCISTGIMTYTCSVCGDFYDKIIEKDEENHIGETDTINLVKATCNSNGYTGDIVCLDCGEIKESGIIINSVAHSEETIIGYKATCTENGLTDGVECTVCGETLVAQKVINATGHTDADNNGICDVCAENVSEPVNPGIMIGDVDGNGKITAADARAALRISAKLDIVSAETEKIADIDENGKVTASDARKILRFSAKLDKVLGG